MRIPLAATLAVILPASAALAQDDDAMNEYRPHFTYDFRYPKVLSQENLTDQSLMVPDFAARGLDYLLRQVGTEDEKPMMRQRLTVLTLGAMIPLVKTFKAAGHEMGHLREWSKAGIGNSHFLYQFDDGRTASASNIWEMAGNVMAHSSMGFDGAAANIDDAAFAAFAADPKRAAHMTEFTVALYAGGLNQEQYQSERLADRVLDGKAIFLDFPTWAYSLISVMDYPDVPGPGNDIREYKTWLAKKGVHTNQGSIRNLQWARLASGSSIAMIYGVWSFMKHSERQINQLPFPFPEFASYLTQSGPTFKVRVPVRLSWEGMPLMLEPSYQTPVDRRGHNEFGLRARIQPMEEISCSLGGFANSSGGTWVEGNVTVNPWKWLELGLGFDRGRGPTFQREITGMTFSFLTKEEWSVKLGVGLVLRF